MFNKIILIGRLVRDPEPRYTTNGTAVTKFTLAVDRPFKNKQTGEKEADFIDIITWSKLAEVCANNLSKGRLVAIEGRLQIRSYEDNSGVRRKASEVIAETMKFLDHGKDNGAGTGAYNNQQPSRPQQQQQQQTNSQQQSEPSYDTPPTDFASEISFSDDDVPF